MASVAILGGTAFSKFSGIEWKRDVYLENRYGLPSMAIKQGRYADADVFFLGRHGEEGQIPPHRINYRANIKALKELGVTHILAVNAVGGIGANTEPGALLVPDQVIDYTWGRQSTFCDGEGEPLSYIDFTNPYSENLRHILIDAAIASGSAVIGDGVYGCTQGPRLETAAEVQRCRRDGCTLLGMTGMPEAALAREAGISYASLCLVVNWGAGMTNNLIDMEEIRRITSDGAEKITGLLLRAVESVTQM